MKEKIILGANNIALDHLISIVRGKLELEFDSIFIDRVNANRKIVDNFAKNNQLLYGITTGLGNNCTEIISEDDRKACQVNTVRSHATSLGEPWDDEVVRSIMFVMIVHLGNGHSGIRLETLELLRLMLNYDIIPIVPRHGSVGYLSLEAHVAMAMLGENDVIYKSKKTKTIDVFRELGIKPLDISAKEGLSLTSGTTSVTAISALAIYDSIIALQSTDIIASMTIEVLEGNLMAMDERLHAVRHHIHQQNTAFNIRNILKDSEILKNSNREKIQDPLSLRAIPQLHGAAKRVLADALFTLENELNSSVDNPLIFDTPDKLGIAIMGCNADGSYLGMQSDNAMIAITGVSKMSERRTNRLVSKTLTSLPAFLVNKPGLNNGLMIPQYSSVGMLGEMRIMSHPATIDNGTMSDMQEDFVNMGYNASKKFYEGVNLFRYIIATELLYSLQAYGFRNYPPAKALEGLFDSLRKTVPFFESDTFYAPYIETLNDLIKAEVIVKTVKSSFIDFKF